MFEDVGTYSFSSSLSTADDWLSSAVDIFISYGGYQLQMIYELSTVDDNDSGEINRI